MSLRAGDVLGHYRIADKIGEGGMGVVWRATDTTLGRDVALKTLPADVASDPERIARFEREAKVLASLNHPAIAAIHGLHEAQGVRFLAMELVPGEDLAARLVAGGLSVDQSLEIARQIAEALEAAHEQGIVHRDLKPANVKVTPDGKVKLLDFGLAKALDPTTSGASSASRIAKSPTLTLGATVQGLILGTAAYMAPEQAAGSAVDRRADIWAFGVLLYEMLAGRRLFVGETTSHVLASVLKDEPDFDALPEGTPPRVRRLLRRCLRKRVRERLQAIGDARVALEETLAGAPDEIAPHAPAAAPARAVRPWHLLAVGGAALAVGVLLGASWLGEPPAPVVPPRTVAEFRLPDQFVAVDLALSPDGSRLALTGRDATEASWRLWVRHLGSPELRLIPGTDGASMPFWSPDGRSIGFVASRQLKRVDLEGGQPIRLAAVEGACGASWGREAILFCTAGALGLMRIPPTGGEPVEVTRPADGQAHILPEFLGGGPRFTYVSFPSGASPTAGRLHLARLDGGADREIMAAESRAMYSEGRLYYLRDATLLARTFDPSTGALGGGDAELVAEGVDDWRGGAFALGPGLLVYLAQQEREGSRITVYDRDGRVRHAIDSDTFLDDLSVSRDGRRAAVMKSSVAGQSGSDTVDVWTVDLDRRMFSRATFGEQDDDPVFSPDGSRIAFAHDGDLYVGSTNGSGEPTLLVDSGADIVTSDWTRDGWILYTDIEAGTDDLFAVPEAGGESRRLTKTPFRELTPQVSPDGRWLAYTSNEAGDAQVYLTRWPSLDGKWRVSSASAAMPRFGKDGGALYFLTRDRRIFRATVAPGASEPVLGLPEELFQTNFDGSYTARTSRWAVLPDGSGFLVLETLPGQESRTSELMVVTRPSAR